MSKYIKLTKENFEEEIEKFDGVALVDFWAPWCGPCKTISPVIEELANDYEGKAKICKVNTDEETDLAIKFGIRSIPSILFFKNGEIVDKSIGVTSKIDLVHTINNLLLQK